MPAPFQGSPSKVGHGIKTCEIVFVCTTGRGARFIGDMHGGESDEVGILCHFSVTFSKHLYTCSLGAVSSLLLVNQFERYLSAERSTPMCTGQFSHSIVSYLPFFKSFQAKSKRPVSLTKQQRTGKVCVGTVYSPPLVVECVKRKN